MAPQKEKEEKALWEISSDMRIWAFFLKLFFARSPYSHPQCLQTLVDLGK